MTAEQTTAAVCLIRQAMATGITAFADRMRDGTLNTSGSVLDMVPEADAASFAEIRSDLVADLIAAAGAPGSKVAADVAAERADKAEAERDRLTDERDTLRAALDQERRSMANRLAALERIKGERDRLQASVAAAQRWIGDHIREEREQGIDGAFIDGGCLRTLQRDMDEALSGGDGGATAVEVDVVPDLGRFHERIAAVASYLGKSETALRSVYAEAIREDAAARRALAEAIDRWAQAPVSVRWALDESQPCDSGVGEEGSRTRETGARTDEQGGAGMSGGSGAAGAAEGVLSVSVSWIARQRTLGWPDMHPEDYCHRCGNRNPMWCADREDWLTATSAWAAETGREGICCPTCFAEMHRAATGRDVTWRITPWRDAKEQS